MAVFCQNLKIADLSKAVAADVSFIHSRPEVKYMCILYCLAIRCLIKGANSADRVSNAIQMVEDYVS